MNSIPAAKSSSTARWADAARRRSHFSSSQDLPRCITWLEVSRLGRSAWIRRCRSTTICAQNYLIAPFWFFALLRWPTGSFRAQWQSSPLVHDWTTGAQIWIEIVPPENNDDSPVPPQHFDSVGGGR